MTETPDTELLEQFVQNGSEEAFKAMVERYLALVHSVALRHTANPGHAQDITQAVFIILARKAGSLGRKTVLPGWLYRTARLTAANFQRAEMRRIRREQEAFMQSTLEEPATDALWRELSPLLDEAMSRLPATERDALILRYFQNKSVAEVGTFLGVQTNTAQQRVGRALEKLRKFFAKRGVASTTAVLAGAISSNSVQAAPTGLAASIYGTALAKGTAASASTLTLAKGTSKIMAWTKTKTIIAGAAAALLVAGAGALVTIETIHFVRMAFAPNIQGTWQGVDNGVGRRHIVLRLSKTNGVYRASTDWPELGKKGVPMGKVVYDYPNLEIQQNPRNIWQLKVNSAGTEMVWDQYIRFIEHDPVRFTRTTTPFPVPEPLSENDFAPRPGSALQGYWEGEIGAGTDAVPVDLKIAESADGTIQAAGDIPVLGIRDRPLIVSYRPPVVQFKLADGTGLFRGQINYSDTELSGRFIQGNVSLPVTVRRADYQAEHAHDEDQDYSFTSDNDLQGHWKGSWIVPIGKTRTPIREALDIAKLPDGSYSATMANVDEFGAEAPVPASDFEYSPPTVHMEWKWEGWAYDGTLEKGELVGTWSEGGGGFPLVFERSQ